MKKNLQWILPFLFLAFAAGSTFGYSETCSTNENPFTAYKNGIVLPESFRQEMEATINAEINKLNFGIGTFTTDTDSLSSGSIGGLLDDEMEAIAKARSVISKIKQAGNFIQQITGGDLISLPVGISKTIGNITYTMGISEIKLKPSWSELEVFLEIAFPDKAPLLFGASDIKFTKIGGIVGNAHLGLLADFGMDISQGKTLLVLKKMRVNPTTGEYLGGTFVEIDCDGFQALSIDAEVWFSRDWVRPLIDTTQTARVKGRFETYVTSWEDILFSFSMDPFVIKGMEDVGFAVTEAVFDFSETKHDPVVQYPSNYPSPLAGDLLWKGFYLKNLTITLPERLTGSGATTISGYDIIIDDLGFTGIVEVTNIFGLNSSNNLEGWAFSMDTFRLRILTQQFQEVSFAGNVHVPMFKSEENTSDTLTAADCFSYLATISQGNIYNFSLASNGTYKVDMWKANAYLAPNSIIDIHYENDEVTAIATLFGTIEIEKDVGAGMSLNVPDLTFDSLQLSNKSPHFSPGTWGFPDSLQVGLGDFGITLSQITVTEVNDTAALSLNAYFRLTNNDLAISAGGGFIFKGSLEEVNNRQRWDFASFKVNRIEVEASFHGVDQLQASLDFYENHNTFGTGFRGTASIHFSAFKFGIDAVAQFGSLPTYKYFLVDALAEFDGSGIDIGGLSIKGFGGGVYRHMARPPASEAFAQFTNTPNGAIPTALGASLSGIEYTPDETVALGVKASVIVTSSGNPNAFNANVSFGMQFGTNTEGGISLDRVFFQGIAQFMKETNPSQAPNFAENSQPENNGQGILAYIMLDFDIQNKIFQANLDVSVNTSNGLTGHGWAEMYFEKLDAPDAQGRERLWYIFVGTPDNRDSLYTQIPLINANILLTAYLMMGNDSIPDIPPPAIPYGELGISEFAYTPSSGNDISTTGAGFTFGASLSLSTGKRKVLFFYYDITAGLGFDISILDYGEAQCANTGEQIGINGWYASGQAWAYFGGDIGLEAKVFGKVHSFKILEITFYIKVIFQKKDGADWMDVLDDNGNQIFEDTTVVFTTGPAPDGILTENIAASYPVDRQLHFHAWESTKGGIKLDVLQNDIFTQIPESYKVYARFSTTDGQIVATEPVISSIYLIAQGQIKFPIPSWALAPTTIHKLEIVVMEKLGAGEDETTNVGNIINDSSFDPTTMTQEALEALVPQALSFYYK